MRKVIMSIVTVAVLTVALALPAAAATPNGKNCNKSWNWSRISAPAITQPTNCPRVQPGYGGADSSKLDLSQIFNQFEAQLGNCFNGMFGN
jgi:hypothetical protein